MDNFKFFSKWVKNCEWILTCLNTIAIFWVPVESSTDILTAQLTQLT